MSQTTPSFTELPSIATMLALVAGLSGAAQADVLVDATRAVMRPETDDETNIVRLLDARGTLLELKVGPLSLSRGLKRMITSVAQHFPTEVQQSRCRCVLQSVGCSINSAHAASPCRETELHCTTLGSDQTPFCCHVTTGTGIDGGGQRGALPRAQAPARHGQAAARGAKDGMTPSRFVLGVSDRALRSCPLW